LRFAYSPSIAPIGRKGDSIVSNGVDLANIIQLLSEYAHHIGVLTVILLGLLYNDFKLNIANKDTIENTRITILNTSDSILIFI
jgi:hypothetical protein